jgi:hypothetical protein
MSTREKSMALSWLIYSAIYFPVFMLFSAGRMGLFIPFHLLAMLATGLVVALAYKDLYERPFPTRNAKVKWLVFRLLFGPIIIVYIFRHALKPRGCAQSVDLKTEWLRLWSPPVRTGIRAEALIHLIMHATVSIVGFIFGALFLLLALVSTVSKVTLVLFNPWLLRELRYRHQPRTFIAVVLIYWLLGALALVVGISTLADASRLWAPTTLGTEAGQKECGRWAVSVLGVGGVMGGVSLVSVLTH